jgi:hypothetical protein
MGLPDEPTGGPEPDPSEQAFDMNPLGRTINESRQPILRQLRQGLTNHGLLKNALIR